MIKIRPGGQRLELSSNLDRDEERSKASAIPPIASVRQSSRPSAKYRTAAVRRA